MELKGLKGEQFAANRGSVPPLGWVPLGQATAIMWGSSTMVSPSPQKEQDVQLLLNKFSDVLNFWTEQLSLCLLHKGGKGESKNSLKGHCKQTCSISGLLETHVERSPGLRLSATVWKWTSAGKIFGLGRKMFLIFRIHGLWLWLYDAKRQEEHWKFE